MQGVGGVIGAEALAVIISGASQTKPIRPAAETIPQLKLSDGGDG
jgi:hypothetical protein